jgi:hypothetical protein
MLARRARSGAVEIGRLRRAAIMAEIKLGDVAPGFRLPATGKQEIGPADFSGKQRVVLAFYPFDWSPG